MKGWRGTPTYRAYHGAKQRCFNPKSTQYRFYGARGIKMCQRWLNGGFEAFLADMGPCPQGHSIERADVNGDYEPGNCIWLPKSQQAINQRTTRWLEYGGRRQHFSAWARELSMPFSSLHLKLKTHSIGEIIEL